VSYGIDKGSQEGGLANARLATNEYGSTLAAEHLFKPTFHKRELCLASDDMLLGCQAT
jgi:hypothetical protein